MSEPNLQTGPREASRAVPGGVPPVAIIVSVVTLVSLVAAVLVGLALAGELDETTTPLVVSLIGIVVTTVPALLGMVYSERVSRDVRNGVLVKQARQGAVEAIVSEQVMTRTGPVVTTELQALQELLVVAREGHTANTAAGPESAADTSTGPGH